MDKILKMLLPLLVAVLPKVSKEIRESLLKFLQGLQVKAKATPNPFDDIILAILIGILD